MNCFSGGEREGHESFALEVHHFTEAERFLDALSPRHTAWKPPPVDWIFRGQADAAWRLVPAVFREFLGVPTGPALSFSARSTHGAQILEELNHVRHFVQRIDQQGLPLPTEHSFQWGSFLHMADAVTEPAILGNWPPPEAAPLFALAQHFAIPTRLLDWTERPLVAAYFAAVDACERQWRGESHARALAVWALCAGRAQAIIDEELGAPRPPSLRLVRPPRFTNPNLRAQNGILTLLVDSTRRYESRSGFPPLDELLYDRAQRVGKMAPVLIKLTLPWSQAGTLLRLLADELIDATQLFPGFSGAARAVRETAFWDKAYLARGS